MEDYSYILKNIEDIELRIKAAAEKSGRKKEEVLLLAVTKTLPTEKMRTALLKGLKSFGENKVQEITAKYDEFISDGVLWHLIGHLQTNKVKYIIDKVVMIHSVDSVKLASEINKRAKDKGIVMDILLEINIAREESKFGINPNEVFDIINEIKDYENIRVRGLMAVAPFVENGEENRPYFKQMKQLLVDINEKKFNNICMNILSMGMTGDYETAIEEGANIVRIGTGIFGARKYN
ncbi:MAG: YggS family pyridoxal phosphate-dependent enzyme [Lachnospiraceae bacterium]|nr:YggS family pyridoxal phosphate-dependent enzyme [Lachnospiraceae bacterium]